MDQSLDEVIASGAKEKAVAPKPRPQNNNRTAQHQQQQRNSSWGGGGTPPVRKDFDKQRWGGHAHGGYGGHGGYWGGDRGWGPSQRRAFVDRDQKAAKATKIENDKEGNVIVRLYNTAVVTFKKAAVLLSSGGFHTLETKIVISHCRSPRVA